MLPLQLQHFWVWFFPNSLQPYYSRFFELVKLFLISVTLYFYCFLAEKKTRRIFSQTILLSSLWGSNVFIVRMAAASRTLQNGLSTRANHRDMWKSKEVRDLLTFANCFPGNRFIPRGIHLKATCSISNIWILLH